MARYIDADLLQKEIANGKNKPIIYDGADEVLWIEECIKNAPAADVEEVRHGKWIRRVIGNEYFNCANYYCSKCGRILIGLSSPKEAPYCYCGAKMDGRKD